MWANGTEWKVLKGKMQIVNKYLKKCSTSLAIGTVQIEITFWFLLTLVTMVIIKETKDNEDVKKEKPLYTADGNINCCSRYTNQCANLQNTKNRTAICDPVTSLPWLHTQMILSAFYLSICMFALSIHTYMDSHLYVYMLQSSIQLKEE